MSGVTRGIAGNGLGLAGRRDSKEGGPQILDRGSYVLWRPVPLDSGPDLPQVRELEVEAMTGVTDVAVLVLSYLSNLCDPILDIQLKVGCAGVLPRRHDQDTGIGIASQPSGRTCR